MYILGIGGYYHDASACLIKDGAIVAAAEEERFNRIKHSKGLPYQAIDFCLEKAKISLDQIDEIGFYWNPWLWLRSRLLYRAKMFFRAPFSSIADIINVGYTGFLPLLELQKLKSPRTKLRLINHHLAHSASAFFVSPFERAGVLSMDFFGEETTTYSAIGSGNNLNRIKEIKYPHSLGALYASITQYLGFEVDEGEYKVMGLASYGEPKYYADLKDIVKIMPKGAFKLNLSYFNYHLTGSSQSRFVSDKFIRKFGPGRQPGERLTQAHMDIACSLQKTLEAVVLHIVEHAYSQHQEENLCLAGGVGLNCVLNSVLLAKSSFKSIFVQPAAGDGGCAMGCCYYIYNQIKGNPRVSSLKDVYFGPEYSNDEIKNELDNNKLDYKYYENIEEITAGLLAEDKIVGWFQGRMEWGPRALGNRSILANPSNPKMKDMVNTIVKRREEFRPFAPSVLAEDASACFDISEDSPFMLFIQNVKNEVRDKIPAVTHIDGTARVQTVAREINPRFWSLISEFKKRTGIPLVLNTSFNLRGEPIVCSPRDAIRTFYSSGLDCLVLGNHLISK
jgi:carbamoyltransferase